MNWQTYRLQLLTPCFCAGADQQKAEIRVPSIRGQLRWWFRALGGTAEEEVDVFGTVHGSARKSSLKLRLLQPVVSSLAKNLEDFGFGMSHPQSYLLWPLRPTRQSQQKRGVLPAGCQFDLQVELSGVGSLVQKAQATLEIWRLLGALGTRSRRGYGSVWPNEKNNGDDLNWMTERLSKEMQVFDNKSFKALAFAECKSADEALCFLGNWLKQWRVGSTRYGGKPKIWGQNDHDAGLGKSNRVYRPVLGLPLTQRYQEGPTVQTVLDDGNDTDRWASPIHLKVIRCGASFYPLAVFFPQMAMPHGQSLIIRNRNQDHPVSADRALLDEMMKPSDGITVVWGG